MTTPATRRPATRARMPQLPREAAEAASRLLFHRQAARPVETLAWAAAAGLAAAPRVPSAEPGTVHLEMEVEVWLDALFSDWAMSPDPWPKAEAKAALPVLQQVVNSQRSILPPLPAFPARPALTPSTLDKLWHHLDLAGWRVYRFTFDPELEPHVDRRVHVGHLIHEGVDLLEQFHLMMLKAYKDHGASARDYTEELADLLRRIHATLDQAAQAAGRDPLGWPIPDYRPFLGEPYPLPKGPRGSALPENLAADLQRALDARNCPRPLSTVLPLVQRYSELNLALNPHWTWSPSRDGRECAFLLFESGLEELPDWKPAQARELAKLCTAVHAWGEGQPVPPHPALAIDPADDRAEALWLHQDLLLLAGTVLGVELGVIPDPDNPQALKRQRRLQSQWSELQAMIWGALFHWGAVDRENRVFLAETLPVALGAVYQELRNQIAGVDRAFLRFIPKPPDNLIPRAKTPMVRFGRIKKR